MWWFEYVFSQFPHAAEPGELGPATDGGSDGEVGHWGGRGRSGEAILDPRRRWELQPSHTHTHTKLPYILLSAGFLIAGFNFTQRSVQL
jgi:hypothetical protein